MGEGNRRPLASRDRQWALALSRRLALAGVSPNRISGASMIAGLIAGLAFWASGMADGYWPHLLFLCAAALFMQLRLLCNLMDGMVAVEGGKAAADGPFWNEFPDRIADILIIGGAGLAAGNLALGFAGATFAVFTAYVREHGRACGLPADFSGPMAKQHRMALLTLAALAAAISPPGLAEHILSIALWVLLAGAMVTVFRRASRIVAGLRERAGSANRDT